MKPLEKLQLFLRTFVLRWRSADTRQFTLFGRAYNRLSDWLTRVTWKRFFVFCLLLMIVGGMSGSLLEDLLNDRPAKPLVFVEKDKPFTKIIIEADANGVQVRSINTENSTSPAPKKKKETLIQDEQDLEKSSHTPSENPPPPEPPQPPEPPEDPQDLGELLVQKNNVEVRLFKRGDLSEELNQLIEEIKSNITKSTAEKNTEVLLTEPQSRTSRRVNTDSLMQLLMIAILGLIMMKVVLNTQRKAQAKVAAAEEATEREALQRQLVEAKFTTMQAQVEPHFLFNTLASVDHLIEVDPQRASQMQKNLIQYLRAAMPHMRETASTMGREAQLVSSYLKILQFRMEERLEFSVDIPEGLYTADIPPMMLLSLVENAIKHGLEPKPEGGRIDVKAQIVHGKLRVSVADTGLGLSSGKAATSGTGIGLSNIRERLAMLYGSAAQFTITANQPTGTVAVIEIPYKLTSIPSTTER